MKDPMLEIVSALLDRSLFFWGVAFTFSLVFSFILMVGGYNRKRDDGDDSFHCCGTFRYNILQVMRLRKGLFREKHFYAFSL
jgi:hypothetical protein